jgi:predicted transcriptional regulator
MTKESLSTRLRKYLDASVGSHQRIAKAAGVSQGTMSRLHLGGIDATRVSTAEALVAWFDANTEQRGDKLALSLPDAKRVRVHGAESAAASTLAQ